jgi:hypothetical protein
MWECVSRARRGPLLAIIAAAVGIAGCGGHGAAASHTAADGGQAPITTTGSVTSASATSTTASGHAQRHHRADPAAVTVHAPKIGTTQSVHAFGSFLHVTVTSISAVSRGDASPPPGYRGVAVQLRIADEAGQTYDSTASGDLSVIVSHGISAPLDIRAGACETQLVDFESHLYSGDVRTGCVGFSVPRHARVLGVRFSPHARPHGAVTWRTAG